VSINKFDDVTSSSYLLGKIWVCFNGDDISIGEKLDDADRQIDVW
jgi:hypothetical protein